MGDLIDGANTGAASLLDSHDIAIVALWTCLAFAILGNIVQYFVGNRRTEKDNNRQIAMSLAIHDMASSVREVKTVFNFVIDLYKEKKNGS